MRAYGESGSLKRKIVLITGSASGIGESIARAFHVQGSKVAIRV